MKWLLALALSLVFAAHVQAQDGVQASGMAAPAGEAGVGVAAWERTVRSHIDAVLAAVPRIPEELASTAARIRADARSHGYPPILLVFGGLAAFGLAAERIYRSGRPSERGAASALLPIAVFSGTVAVVFFAVDWPPLGRVVLLCYLTAFVCYRIVSALVSLAIHPPSATWARMAAAALLLAVAGSAAGKAVGVAPDVVAAVTYLMSLVVLALAVATAWSLATPARPFKNLLIIGLVAAWMLWSLELRVLFWLAVYALLLPPLLRSVGKTAAALLQEHLPDLRTVLVVRGARALVVVLAAAWLALVWEMNPDGVGHQNSWVTSNFYGLLKSVVVVLGADLLWQIARSWIDRKLAGRASPTDAAGAEREARLRTLLPIFRNALAVVVLVMTALVVLAELGVQIGPLVAGAGVFGVAIGFGSQTLVKDVISGVFYMLDDAFRVGEYIQAKNYKGTVEGFSLRSVRLRHHRGPIFTVPFGELGAVENMSRDWGVVKFRISVGYDTDVEKVRKLTKKIGAGLMEDPELGPLFIEPLKMKGLEEFGEYGLVLSFGMTLKPSPMQSFVRRRANLLLREAFTSNGIQFATPSVQVGGAETAGAEGSAAAAAARLRLRQASPPEA
ncbi:small-conductance mechanosensitive channel transmembrane protein [Bradyrhizobium lupini HPC(L)]|uniref:Small-conductance mechanosensitive channel transmembrane protein n=1 Tax=Bradyrhizobium lupini HPC(L) TaxID=1229491 RepID=A0ABN0HKE6_RHILU|nr:small-conductance mechanosensitive channel transmembrane protein [Bradyrhizobium lupini HPC(L)]